MAQLLGIPLKARLTKDDFDRTMAVHPTAAEELVTMYKPTYRVKDGKRVAYRAFDTPNFRGRIGMLLPV